MAATKGVEEDNLGIGLVRPEVALVFGKDHPFS
jgi:hypothetical protein